MGFARSTRDPCNEGVPGEVLVRLEGVVEGADLVGPQHHRVPLRIPVRRGQGALEAKGRGGEVDRKPTPACLNGGRGWSCDTQPTHVKSQMISKYQAMIQRPPSILRSPHAEVRENSTSISNGRGFACKRFKHLGCGAVPWVCRPPWRGRPRRAARERRAA